MKNKKYLYVSLIIFGIFSLAILLSFFLVNQEEDYNTTKVYYLNTLTNELEGVNVELKADTDVKKVEELLELLKTPPANSNYVSILGDDVKILDWNLRENEYGNKVLDINFSGDYNFIKETQEIYLRTGIVHTVTSLDFVDKAVIYVDKKLLKNDLGEEIEELDKDNVLLNPVISPEEVNSKTVTLYFSDEDAMYLKKEQRTVTVKQSQSEENQIVEQLIAGPKAEGLYPTVPTGTKIRNIKTEENVCYVDLSSDFVSKHTGGSSAETLTIYSIVNSLTELDGVDKVRFLIEGEKVTEFKGHLDLSKAFERNEDLIIQ